MADPNLAATDLVIRIGWDAGVLRDRINGIDDIDYWPRYFAAMIARRLSSIPIETYQEIISITDGILNQGGLVTQERDVEEVEVDPYDRDTLALILTRMSEDKRLAVLQVADLLRAKQKREQEEAEVARAARGEDDPGNDRRYGLAYRILEGRQP